MAIFGNKKNEATKKKTAAPAKKAAPKSAPKSAPKKATVKKEAAPASMKDLYSVETAKPVKAAAKKAASVSVRVLVKPLVTEKAADLGALNKYAFVVTRDANKIEIAKAIEAAYGVKPLKVNVSNVSGKKVARGRIRGQRSDWRKAIVTLPKGQEIRIYEGV
jgi:large subunit ribosomal protein L23